MDSITDTLQPLLNQISDVGASYIEREIEAYANAPLLKTRQIPWKNKAECSPVQKTPTEV